jgi:hypothetical protein
MRPLVVVWSYWEEVIDIEPGAILWPPVYWEIR